eukprot:CFRG6105T1
MSVGYSIFPRHLLVGGGCLKQLPFVLSKMKTNASTSIRNPLVVTDPFLLKSGLVERVGALLRSANLKFDIYHDTISDPTTDSVDKVVHALKRGDHDCVIALGGGSPIDTAKMACVLKTNGGIMSDYKAPYSMDATSVPLIAIPTTAGTGSEVTRFTVITDSGSGEKMLCMGSSYVPDAALVDYELTLSCPYRLTADTAIDTLTHAIESFVSRKHTLFSDRFALSTMTAVNRYIRDACEDPNDVKARERLMLAATEGGIAFSISSVAMVHGMSRPLGAIFHVPHGLSNAMLLPAVTRFGVETAPERYAMCAVAMGFASENTPTTEAANALVDQLHQLCFDMKVPTLREYGVDGELYRKSVARMVRDALASGSPSNNPRVPTEDEMAAVYHSLYI